MGRRNSAICIEVSKLTFSFYVRNWITTPLSITEVYNIGNLVRDHLILNLEKNSNTERRNTIFAAQSKVFQHITKSLSETPCFR